ncbi:hypothetical protein RDI58_027276 [Solanum bulbocastanum]|uniref:Uncharacterized protein n=1 Tax=Solanum bulbocastanum TaxID=147425 RepID=A0AAN8Y1N8_SOLBU
MLHLFLTGDYAKSIWTYFVAAVGIKGPFIQLTQAITQWWKADCSPKLKPLY